ncbi:hypothetical protein OIO90_005302 [Microbotryomycetes sp. JL221]|nr:hypothetical protein OIO90_005302 [Microbotryomycetes sp. JL221]
MVTPSSTLATEQNPAVANATSSSSTANLSATPVVAGRHRSPSQSLADQREQERLQRQREAELAARDPSLDDYNQFGHHHQHQHHHHGYQPHTHNDPQTITPGELRAEMETLLSLRRRSMSQPASVDPDLPENLVPPPTSAPPTTSSSTTNESSSTSNKPNLTIQTGLTTTTPHEGIPGAGPVSPTAPTPAETGTLIRRKSSLSTSSTQSTTNLTSPTMTRLPSLSLPVLSNSNNNNDKAHIQDDVESDTSLRSSTTMTTSPQRQSLFWLPASLHPELAPQEFKAFIREQTRPDNLERRTSLGSSANGGSRRGSMMYRGTGIGVDRRKSMLRGEYKPRSDDGVGEDSNVSKDANSNELVGEDVNKGLTRTTSDKSSGGSHVRRTSGRFDRHQQHFEELTIKDLQRLEELAAKAEAEAAANGEGEGERLGRMLRRSLSLNPNLVAAAAASGANLSFEPSTDPALTEGEDAVASSSDSPLVVHSPGQILRRTARTKIRKPGLGPGDGGGHRFGPSTRRGPGARSVSADFSTTSSTSSHGDPDDSFAYSGTGTGSAGGDTSFESGESGDDSRSVYGIESNESSTSTGTTSAQVGIAGGGSPASSPSSSGHEVQYFEVVSPPSPSSLLPEQTIVVTPSPVVAQQQYQQPDLNAPLPPTPSAVVASPPPAVLEPASETLPTSSSSTSSVSPSSADYDWSTHHQSHQYQQQQQRPLQQPQLSQQQQQYQKQTTPYHLHPSAQGHHPPAPAPVPVPERRDSVQSTTSTSTTSSSSSTRPLSAPTSAQQTPVKKSGWARLGLGSRNSNNVMNDDDSVSSISTTSSTTSISSLKKKKGKGKHASLESDKLVEATAKQQALDREREERDLRELQLQKEKERALAASQNYSKEGKDGSNNSSNGSNNGGGGAGGFFGSLFSSSKRKSDQDHPKRTASPPLDAYSRQQQQQQSSTIPTQPQPPPPTASGTMLIDGTWINFYRLPIHVERAVYRLSHIKLANPRRPLYEQVLISNLMFWYLSVINKPQLPVQAPPTPVQQQQSQPMQIDDVRSAPTRPGHDRQQPYQQTRNQSFDQNHAEMSKTLDSATSNQVHVVPFDNPDPRQDQFYGNQQHEGQGQHYRETSNATSSIGDQRPDWHTSSQAQSEPRLDDGQIRTTATGDHIKSPTVRSSAPADMFAGSTNATVEHFEKMDAQTNAHVRRSWDEGQYGIEGGHHPHYHHQLNGVHDGDMVIDHDDEIDEEEDDDDDDDRTFVVDPSRRRAPGKQAQPQQQQQYLSSLQPNQVTDTSSRRMSTGSSTLISTSSSSGHGHGRRESEVSAISSSDRSFDEADLIDEYGKISPTMTMKPQLPGGPISSSSVDGELLLNQVQEGVGSPNPPLFGQVTPRRNRVINDA